MVEVRSWQVSRKPHMTNSKILPGEVLVLIAEACIEPYDIPVKAASPVSIEPRSISSDLLISPTNLALVSSDFRTGVGHALRTKFDGQVVIKKDLLGPFQEIARQKQLEWLTERISQLTVSEDEPLSSAGDSFPLYVNILHKNVLRLELGLTIEQIDEAILKRCVLIHRDMRSLIDGAPNWKNPELTIVRLLFEDSEILTIRRRKGISENDLLVTYSNNHMGWSMMAEAVMKSSSEKAV